MKPVKIRFNVETEDIDAEWLWAMPVGGWNFQLDNSPFHLFGLSYGDIIEAHLVEGCLEFVRVVVKQGHGTVRVKLPAGASHDSFRAFWPALLRLGCSYEGSQVARPTYSIDIPPDSDARRVILTLASLEAAGVLEYEEGDLPGLASDAGAEVNN